MSAKPSSITNHRPHCFPSPGGEGKGEGELNLRGPKSALIFILTPDSWILNSSFGTLLNAPPGGYPMNANRNTTTSFGGWRVSRLEA